MRGRLGWLGVLAGCVAAGACNDRSPSPTAPMTRPALDGPYRLAGQVSVTLESTTVEGAAVTISFDGAESTAVTDATGQFAFPAVPAGHVSVKVVAPGFLTHYMASDVNASAADLRLDVIRNAVPFDLTFYRNLARNGLGGGNLSELRPWQQNPSVYVRTLTVDTGEMVEPTIVDGLRQVMAESVPELSGNRFQLARFEAGPEARSTENGWIIVVFWAEPPWPEAWVGRSRIGGPSGLLELRYNASTRAPSRNVNSPCESIVRTMQHEMSHAMGFWHTDNNFADLSTPNCAGAGRSERARFHARIAYSRPPGNADIDDDRTTTDLTVRANAAAPTISCGLEVTSPTPRIPAGG